MNFKFEFKIYLNPYFAMRLHYHQFFRKIVLLFRSVILSLSILSNKNKLHISQENHGISNSNSSSIFRNASCYQSLHYSLCINHIVSTIRPFEPVSTIFQSNFDMEELSNVATCDDFSVFWNFWFQFFLQYDFHVSILPNARREFIQRPNC